MAAKSNHLLQKFGKDLILYLPAKALPALAMLLCVPIITKLFRPQDYGDYILATTTISLFSMVPSQIWGTSITRFFYIYVQESKLSSFYTTLFMGGSICVISIVMLFFALFNLLKDSISQNLYDLFNVGVVLLGILSIYSILLSILNAKQKSLWYSGCTIWQSWAGLGFGLVLIFFFGYGVSGLIWGSIAALAIITIPMYVKVIDNVSFGSFSKDIAHEMIGYSYPLVFVALAAWALSLSDRYLIGAYRGSYEVGLYSASYTLSEQTMVVIWNLFMLAAYPLITSAWAKEGRDKTQFFVGKLTRYFLIVAIPAATGLAALSKDLVMIFTAPDYYEGHKVVPLVVFGALLLGLQWWAQIGLLLNKKTKTIMLAVICSGVFNICLNFIFVPKYGYTAAAATTFISYAILFIIMVILSSRCFYWMFPIVSCIKIIMASSIMGIVLYAVSNEIVQPNLLSLLLLILLGIAIYAFILILLHEFTRNEIELAYASLI